MAEAKSDVTVDDDLLERWAKEYERGEFTGTPQDLRVRPVFGRPRMFAEPMVPKTIRLRPDQHEQLSALAERDATNPSALIREAWDEYTARRSRDAA